MPIGVSRGFVSSTLEPLKTATSKLRLVGDTGPATVRHTRLAGGIDGAFYGHMVAGMRNGVLAITRDGALALDQRRSPSHFRIGTKRHLARPAVLPRARAASRRGARAEFGVHAGSAAEPRRDAPQAHRHGDWLHPGARPRRLRPGDWRGDVLQGPDPGRAAGGTGAAARPAGGCRRARSRLRARGQEPAGRHRGGRRPAAGAACRRRPKLSSC